MENLAAAIPPVDDSSTLSPQEFQNMLTTWFEEKGIVSDLRSHLRFKMVNVLKNTAIGRNINRKTSQHTSLSKQALNLIVAEFLMRNNCYYSLSIFNTEAALTNVFPEYPMFDSSKEAFRYSSEDILNILELIGVPKSSEFSKEVLDMYFQSKDNCILSCLVTLLCKLTSKVSIDEEVDIDLANGTNFSRQVGNVFIQSNISPKNVSKVIQTIDYLHNEELRNIEDKYTKLVRELKQRVTSQELDIKELNKKKRVVENKLIGVKGDYDALKVNMKKLVKEKLLKENQEQHIEKVGEPFLQKSSPVCSRQHCEEKCEQNDNLLRRLQIENQKLHRKSEEQLEKYDLLSKKYNEVLQDFGDYKNKITFLNSKMNEENIRPMKDKAMLGEPEKSSEANLQSTSDLSESSESVTEEILREARLKLKLLEEESKTIEENFKSIQQGLSYMKL
ncbi:hypothetical protein JTB14_032293 [Gonioctena quinquepunctata]|nr:hypothetical protein JTB14_032293 [Gonioctena quinquepunctata]